MKSINAPTFRPNSGRRDGGGGGGGGSWDGDSIKPPVPVPPQSMFDRNQRWADEVKGRLAEKRAEEEERQSEICTFSPKIEVRPRRKAPAVPS